MTVHNIVEMRKLVAKTKKAMDKAKKAGNVELYAKCRTEWLTAYNAVYCYHQEHGQL